MITLTLICKYNADINVSIATTILHGKHASISSRHNINPTRLRIHKFIFISLDAPFRIKENMRINVSTKDE
jgi:hypothetical protein